MAHFWPEYLPVLIDSLQMYLLEAFACYLGLFIGCIDVGCGSYIYSEDVSMVLRRLCNWR